MSASEGEKNLHCANLLCVNSGRSWWGLKRPPQGIRVNERWYCSMDCMESGLERTVKRLDPKTAQRHPLRYRRPLGLLMLTRGMISQEFLRSALLAQRDKGHTRIGEWLCRMGAVTEEQLTAALSLQWGCPVFPLERSNKFLEWSDLVPLPLLRDAGIVIVHCQPRSPVYYVGFSLGIDHTVLRGLEAMLDFETEPCVVMQSALDAAHNQIEKQVCPPCRVVKGEHHPAVIARTVREEAESTGVEVVRMVGLAGYYWLRLQKSSQTSHLLFEIPELSDSGQDGDDEPEAQ